MAKSPPPKKRGMGCCGCGCLILVLLVLLLVALIGGGGYMMYHNGIKVTSTTPAAIPTFDGGDDIYSAALQKMQGFSHDVGQHLPATIHLNSDEINTLIARNPNFKKNDIHLFVTLQDDQARVRSSIPSSLISYSTMKGRYLNSDIFLGLGFDSNTKAISFNLKRAQLGDTSLPTENMAAIQAAIDPAANSLLQQNASYKAFIDRVSSIEIKNNELVIEAK